MLHATARTFSLAGLADTCDTTDMGPTPSIDWQAIGGHAFEAGRKANEQGIAHRRHGGAGEYIEYADWALGQWGEMFGEQTSEVMVEIITAMEHAYDAGWEFHSEIRELRTN